MPRYATAFLGPILLAVLVVSGCSTAPYRWPEESTSGGRPAPQEIPDAGDRTERRSPPEPVGEEEPAQETVSTPLPAIARSPERDAPDAPESDPTLPAVAALTRDAEQHRRNGDLDRAAALLERGLHIAPRDPGLWHRLALVHLEQGDGRQAEQLARRSTALAAGDRALQLRNWEIVAEARRMQGDGDGAQRALERARALRSGETG
ncbi:MAG: tetratricopeptide repeat protein [Ectothiorhodospira sp.]